MRSALSIDNAVRPPRGPLLAAARPRPRPRFHYVLLLPAPLLASTEAETSPVNDFGSAKIEDEDENEDEAEELMGGMNAFLRLIPHLREYGGEAVCS